MKFARAHGVQVAKLTQLDGIPDRCFFLPGGRPLLVEFKRLGKEPEELQAWHLNALVKAGYRAAHCDTWEEFQELVEGVRWPI